MPWDFYWTLILQIFVAVFVLFLPLGFLIWFLVRSAGFGIASVAASITRGLIEARGKTLKDPRRER